jgi:hypothetical protein
MSTKRPSIVINSDIIQKYIGSDFDAIAFLDQRIKALENSIGTVPDFSSLLESLAEVETFLNGNLYVEKPLLDNPVDFGAEGYPDEDTLGAVIAALAIDATLTKKADRGTIVVADYATQQPLGIFNYTGGSSANIPNDGLGDSTNALSPESITSFYDFTLQQFDFSEFALGDFITLRVDLDITVNADQEIDLLVTLAEGTPSAKSIKMSREYFKNIGTYNVVGEASFNIANTDIQGNPGHVQIYSANGADIRVNTFEAFITSKN